MSKPDKGSYRACSVDDLRSATEPELTALGWIKHGRRDGQHWLDRPNRPQLD